MLPDNGTIVFESIANIHKGKYVFLSFYLVGFEC